MTVIVTLTGPIYQAISSDIGGYPAISGDIGRYRAISSDIRVILSSVKSVTISLNITDTMASRYISYRPGWHYAERAKSPMGKVG